MNKHQNIEATFDIQIQEIATHLGSDWTTDPEGNIEGWARLNHLEGAGLVIRVSGDRYCISGATWNSPESNPGGCKYATCHLAISVSASKTSKAIARDIQRRLLPQYLDWYAQAKSEGEQNYKLDQEVKATAQKLANIVGVTPWTSNPYVFSKSSGANAGDYFLKGRATSYLGGTVELELKYLTPEQAFRVLEALIDERRRLPSGRPQEANTNASALP
ncbi:MAG: hypothetical protein LDL41_03285 [Coleofasciculus sp. S288]|nr:hypothetical protein [Coleofasciculus sp. S288]